MKTLDWKKIALVLSLSALVACGGDDDDNGNGLENEQFPQEENVSSFSTRINNNLLIAGSRCNGSETATDSGGVVVTCEKDQWLITIDNVNVCTPDGACTEIGVIPFIAELDRSDRVSIPDETFFEIDPISEVTPAQTDIADDYLVRFDLDNEEATVISR